MSDRRYNTKAWRQLRAAVLERDNFQCMVGGARCSVHASTVDHIVPVSQGGSFWAPENLRAACRKCNYGAGAGIAHQNRRETEARLREIIQEQDQRITELVAQVIDLEAAARVKRTPAIR